MLVLAVSIVKRLCPVLPAAARSGSAVVEMPASLMASLVGRIGRTGSSRRLGSSSLEKPRSSLATLAGTREIFVEYMDEPVCLSYASCLMHFHFSCKSMMSNRAQHSNNAVP